MMNRLGTGNWETGIRAYVFRDGDVLLARVVYRAGGEERWSSTDGVAWETPLPASRPDLRNRDRPLSGVGTTRYVENRVAGYPNIQVPTDGGETWASIPGPLDGGLSRWIVSRAPVPPPVGVAGLSPSSVPSSPERIPKLISAPAAP